MSETVWYTKGKRDIKVERRAGYDSDDELRNGLVVTIYKRSVCVNHYVWEENPDSLLQSLGYQRLGSVIPSRVVAEQ